MKTYFLTLCLLLSSGLVVSACSPDAPETEAALALSATTAAVMPKMVVYKSPTCGCCKDWVDYVEKAGYAVSTIDHDNIDVIKAKHGLTNPSLKSCHTAIVAGYVIEGHVPVNDIERLLAERPDIVGLTAPGMPMMSPGMGSDIPKDYDVLAFDKDGRSIVYSSY